MKHHQIQPNIISTFSFSFSVSFTLFFVFSPSCSSSMPLIIIFLSRGPSFLAYSIFLQIFWFCLCPSSNFLLLSSKIPSPSLSLSSFSFFNSSLIVCTSSLRLAISYFTSSLVHSNLANIFSINSWKYSFVPSSLLGVFSGFSPCGGSEGDFPTAPP